MDQKHFEDNDNNEYISDSCNESSQSDYHIESDDSEMSDMDIGQDEHVDVNFSVPDIKANPPKWTDRIENITVPPPKSKGGPKLPATFPDTAQPVDYFQLFFTDSLISDIVKFTNQYTQIEIQKKKRTKTNYVDKQWDINGSNNVTVQEMRAYFGTCVILSVAPSWQL